jgi:hypothetical protein
VIEEEHATEFIRATERQEWQRQYQEERRGLEISSAQSLTLFGPAYPKPRIAKLLISINLRIPENPRRINAPCLYP